jgi:hypothetical protein
MEGIKCKVLDNIGSRLNGLDELIAYLHQYDRLHKICPPPNPANNVAQL